MLSRFKSLLEKFSLKRNKNNDQSNQISDGLAKEFIREYLEEPLRKLERMSPFPLESSESFLGFENINYDELLNLALSFPKGIYNSNPVYNLFSPKMQQEYRRIYDKICFFLYGESEFEGIKLEKDSKIWGLKSRLYS